MLSLNEWAVLTGIFCTIGTFFVNWYYEHKKFLRSTARDINCE
ncbi:HP1 family phage holin [Citrobacter youngae]|nr:MULTISPECIES: HP1 family phage holin [Citrobacter]MCF0037304.1 phage holin family protein [Citrobacter freundii]MCL5517922.1 phage holin family protein [Citrobacter cronae]MDM2942348.1 phage holin family protein [Citrobacter sp. Cm038]